MLYLPNIAVRTKKVGPTALMMVISDIVEEPQDIVISI